MKVITILVLISINGIAIGQYNHDYNWLFHNSIVAFDDTLNIIETNSPSLYKNVNATFNSFNGLFLGTTDGCKIYGSSNNILSGTDSLNFNTFVNYHSLCINTPYSGYVAGNQSNIILYNDSTAFLIHEMVNLHTDPLPFYGYSENLLYTSLDISGDSLVLIEREQFIINDTLGLAGVTAVKHSNDKDWWVIKHDLFNNCYHKILFDGQSFDVNGYQCLGGDNTQQGDGGGGAVFSPDGSHYARYSPEDALYLFDFDRETAELFNYQFIDIEKEGIFGGIAFSPSGQYLYVCDRLRIRQYDVWSSDVAASEIIVAEYDGFIGNQLGQGTTFGQMQLAPDCRIYISTGAATPYMHIIMNPDNEGIDCNVKQHNLSLPTFHYSMPHFPNYRLGTEQPLCDSTKVVVLNGTVGPVSTVDLEGEIKVWPNPSPDYINVLMDRHSQYKVEVIDAYGQSVIHFDIQKGEFVVDIRDLAAGVYFLKVEDVRSNAYFVEKVVKL